MIFRNRRDAGRTLASLLDKYADRKDAVVLALPRGGVPVGDEIARELRIPLDVFIVRKLGVPRLEELSMGAISSGGIRYINREVAEAFGIDEETIEAITERERQELARRESLYREGRPPIDVRGKTVILVDDGLVPGSAMRAAITALRQRDPARIIVAVPAGEPNACKEIACEVDETICAAAPEALHAIGKWYVDFPETEDSEVRQLISGAWRRELVRRTKSATEVAIPIGGSDTIQAELTAFPEARALVIFAHGSGSSRHSPRNRFVAEILNEAGLATLLVDLLTAEEEQLDSTAMEHRFDIDLLADRLVAATRWVRHQRTLSAIPIGYFGASTGAAAALVAAARHPYLIDAIVSRGGRPDLAGDALTAVTAPTLFIVGELDETVLELNRRSAMRMRAETLIEIVTGATHLFEEAGALRQAAAMARDWFERTLIRAQAA